MLIMKKFYISFLFLFLFFGWSATAQIVSIPDANFKNVLLNTNCAYLFGDVSEQTDVDANDNGEIEVSEALNVNWLSINSASVTDLSGLESFTNLENLHINASPITSIQLITLSHLRSFTVNNTLLTEINLCGTLVRWLWCQDNPNLQSLYLKNNVVSSDLARSNRQIPPPLHNFEFYNAPLLNYICYDNGEYDAVFHGLNQNTAGRTLTTGCDANCSLSVENPLPENPILLYPNPTSGIINITVPNNQPILKTTINNALGQTIMTFENTLSVDISLLTSGTYFVTVETDTGKATQKVIKL
jgi:hypothetical protein